jgi:hypothetical protein
MSSRCKCCDVVMSLRDFRLLKEDGSEEDLCSRCLGVAYSPDFCDTRRYQFEDICDCFYIPEEYSE